MGDPEQLARDLVGTASLVLGEVGDPLGPFLADGLTAPVGFVSFDMDYYSSTVDCLRIFDLPADDLLPVVVSYFDDLTGSPKRIGSAFRSSRTGQDRAIREFNDAHVLDQPLRSAPGDRTAASMHDHKNSSTFDWPL